MQVHKATLDTRNFHFECYSQHNQVTAKVKLIDALAVHGKQYKLPSNWFNEYLDGIELQSFDLGVGYRDGESL